MGGAGAGLTIEELRELIAGHLQQPLACVGLHARLSEDLGVDSLAFYALMLEIEERSGLRVTPELARDVCTVEQLHHALLHLRSAA